MIRFKMRAVTQLNSFWTLKYYSRFSYRSSLSLDPNKGKAFFFCSILGFNLGLNHALVFNCTNRALLTMKRWWLYFRPPFIMRRLIAEQPRLFGRCSFHGAQNQQVMATTMLLLMTLHTEKRTLARAKQKSDFLSLGCPQCSPHACTWGWPWSRFGVYCILLYLGFITCINPLSKHSTGSQDFKAS